MSPGLHSPSGIPCRTISYSWWYSGSGLCRLTRFMGYPRSVQHDMGPVTQSASDCLSRPCGVYGSVRSVSDHHDTANSRCQVA